MKKYLLPFTLAVPIIISAPIVLTSCSQLNAVDKNPDSGTNQKPEGKPEEKPETGIKPEENQNITKFNMPGNNYAELGTLFDEEIFKGKQLSEIDYKLIKKSVKHPDKVKVLSNDIDKIFLIKNESLNFFSFAYKINNLIKYQTVYLGGLKQEMKQKLNINQFIDLYKIDGSFNKVLYFNSFVNLSIIQAINDEFTNKPITFSNMVQSTFHISSVLDDIIHDEFSNLNNKHNNKLTYYTELINESDITKQDGYISYIKILPTFIETIYYINHPSFVYSISNKIELFSFEVKNIKFIEVNVPKGELSVKVFDENDKVIKTNTNSEPISFYINPLNKFPV